MPSSYTRLLKDIRVWLFIFFVARLYGITNPPLEAASHWRQCDVLMIARNFYEHNPNILYPTVDVAGEKTGIVGSEFPIYNYLIYLFSLAFGFNDWYGRLINLVISSLGIFYFYKLIERYFAKEAAFYSSIILIVSLWFGYSRITIPDTVAASLCIIGAYYGTRYLDLGKYSDFFLFLVLASLGCLAKISAATLLTVFAIPIFNRVIPFNRKAIITLGAGVIFSFVYVWYFYWVPYLNSTFEFPDHFFMGQSLKDGIQQLIGSWKRALSHFYDTPLKYTGFAVFIVSLFLIVKNKRWLAFLVFLFPFCSFLYIVLVAGDNFSVNSYYPLIMVPSMAFAAGYGLSLLKSKKLVYFILLVVGIEGIANQIHTFNIRYPFSAFTKLEQILDQVQCKQNDLIAINAEGTHDPLPLYMAHRKGWNIPYGTMLEDPDQIESLKALQCKYIVISHVFYESKIDLPYQKIYASNEFTVYKL